MSIVDSHCHLDLVAQKGPDVAECAGNAADAGLKALLQIATCLESSRWNRDLSQDWHSKTADIKPDLYWAAGLHPESADQISDLDAIFDLVRQHRQDPFFWGIGETGLDYFHTLEFQSQQKESLERHLQLAQELKLPIVLHTRDDRSYNPDKTGSVSDALELCRKYPDVRGVLHCFTYTEKEAAAFVEMGWFVSYSGVLTFKNAKAVQQGAIRLPLDCLLVETDAPFLAPVPHRGQQNQPAYVVHTLDYLIDLRHRENGEEPELVRQTIYDNSRRFLELKNIL